MIPSSLHSSETDVSRCAMAAGTIPPSQLLWKFAAYPRQHDLSQALHEIGLNKGETHHALKNALHIGRQGP